jgi:hypothetical protein
MTADLSALLAAATPGPWTVERDDDIAGSGDVISWPWRIRWVCDFANEEASEADAALIALAPVLAQACLDAETALKEIVVVVDEADSAAEGANAAHAIARAALTSLRAATGGSK